MRLLGARFPLIVKLIDAGDWLSLQVHPDDALAAELYGDRAVGKAEAWLVLDGDPDARLITGPRRDLGEAALRAGIAAGTLDHGDCEERPAVAGETLLLAAGTLHAIGTGAFVYEIEQPSDITFRISDWGRPAVPGRGLHGAESLRAVRPDAHAIPVGRDWALDGGALAVREFRLEIERPDGAVTRRPSGVSLEVVTAIGSGIDGRRRRLGDRAPALGDGRRARVDRGIRAARTGGLDGLRRQRAVGQAGTGPVELRTVKVVASVTTSGGESSPASRASSRVAAAAPSS